MTLEKDIERPACAYAESRGWFEAKIAQSNKNGMPDRIFHRRGFTMYVEFKRPGEKPTPQQIRRHEQLRAQGIPVHVIDNLEDARAVLR